MTGKIGQLHEFRREEAWSVTGGSLLLVGVQSILLHLKHTSKNAEVAGV